MARSRRAAHGSQADWRESRHLDVAPRAVELTLREMYRHARSRAPVLRLLASDVFAEGELIEPLQGYE